MELRFVVFGEPVGKGRPRFARSGEQVRTYTPDKTVAYETLVRLEYANQCKGLMFADDAQIEAEIEAYFGIPKSASKARRQAMEAGEIRPTKRPDADNIIKSVCDALNSVAYKDDAQVVGCSVQKYYSERPRVEITLREAGEAKKEDRTEWRVI